METHQERREQGMELVKTWCSKRSTNVSSGKKLLSFWKKQAALIDFSKKFDPKPRRLSDLRWQKQSWKRISDELVVLAGDCARKIHMNELQH